MTNARGAANPYLYGRPIQDPQGFFGREQELADLLGAVSRRECVNLVGERRSGKTSLLYHAQRPEVWEAHVRGDGCVAILLDAELVPPSEPEFFRVAFSRLKETVPDLPIGPDEAAWDERRVMQVLQALRPRRLALMIDEFECVSQCDAFAPRFFVFLRGLAFRYDLSMIVATKTRLYECCSHEVVSSPFPNIFKTVHVGPFEEAEFQHFLRRSSQISGCPMWRVADEVRSLGGRFPYLDQMACWHYYRAWQETGTFDDAVHERVRHQFGDEVQAHYAALWNRYLNEAEREAMRGVLAGASTAPSRVLWGLERKGYVSAGRLVPDSLAQWLRMNESEGDIGEPPETAVVQAPSAGLYVDKQAGAVYVDGQRLDPPLTNKQYQFVELLYDNRGRICSPYMIVSAVYSEDYIDEVDDQRIHQLVSRVRKRIEPEGKPWRYVVTVHGRGFTMGDGTPPCD